MAKKTKTRVLLPGGIQALVHDLQNGGSQYGRQPQELADNKEDSAAQSSGANAADGRGGDVAAEPLPAQGRQQETRQDGRGEEARQAAAARQSENAASQGGGQPEDTAPNGVQNAALQSGRDDALADGRNAAGAEVRQTDEKVGVPAGSQEAGAGQSATGDGPSGANVRNGAVGQGSGQDDEVTKEYHIVKDDSKDSWQLFLDMAKQYKDGNGKLATIYIDGTLKNVLDRMKYAGPEKLTTSAILSSIVARFVYDHEDDIRRVLFSGRLL